MKRRHFLNSVLGVVAVSGFVPVVGMAGGKRRPNGYIRTNWSADPYSFGHIRFLRKGLRRDHAALGRRVGERLFFAGEATHPDYNSTVHAAYDSGLMAADSVLDTNAESIGVIGAGMSGLAAANALAKEGYDVTILEARDRIGGRIWTDTRLGQPLDLGASWIHGINGNPLALLAKDLDAATFTTSDRYVVRGGDGRKIADKDAPDWLENVLSVQHTAGADLDDLNAWAYWRDNDYDGKDVVFPGGYSQLFSAFSSDFDIQLGRVVTDIDFGSDAVRVKDQDGVIVTFDAVIVTAPLGVLKRGAIIFNPPLPPEKQNAIAKLGMGVLDKVYLRYDDIFWDKDVTWIATPENGLPKGQFNQWLNLYPMIGQPVIMAFNGAQPARDLALLSDTDVVERASQTLNLAYP